MDWSDRVNVCLWKSPFYRCIIFILDSQKISLHFYFLGNILIWISGVCVCILFHYLEILPTAIIYIVSLVYNGNCKVIFKELLNVFFFFSFSIYSFFYFFPLRVGSFSLFLSILCYFHYSWSERFFFLLIQFFKKFKTFLQLEQIQSMILKTLSKNGSTLSSIRSIIPHLFNEHKIFHYHNFFKVFFNFENCKFQASFFNFHFFFLRYSEREDKF